METETVKLKKLQVTSFDGDGSIYINHQIKVSVFTDREQAMNLATGIVRACNSHYELLEALKKAHNFIDVFKNKMGRALPKDWNDAMSAGLIDMDETIKKATS